MDISVIVTAAVGNPLVGLTLRSVRAACARAGMRGVRCEILIAGPEGYEAELVAAAQEGETVSIGLDLEAAGRRALVATRGRAVATVDADGLFGESWIDRAYARLEERDFDNVVIHPEYSLIYGRTQRLWRHIGMEHPDFRAGYLAFGDYFTPYIFAPQAILQERPPPFDAGSSAAGRNWTWKTMEDGVAHLTVDETLHAVRVRRTPR